MDTITRCIKCSKKIKEHVKVAYRCKCMEYACYHHKFDHDCKFDHKTKNKALLDNVLAKNLSVKLEKI